VFGGMAQKGVCKIGSLAPGKYKVSFTEVQINAQGAPAVQQGELVVLPDGQLTGTELRVK
jgi:hypothetical protein